MIHIYLKDIIMNFHYFYSFLNFLFIYIYLLLLLLFLVIIVNLFIIYYEFTFYSFIHFFLLFSIRLSETGLHGYVELARKVKFFGGNGSGTVPLTIGSDEVVQRDSATSAGEDDPHDDNHGRTGPVSSQGRSMLRRRRQFDAEGM